MKWNLKLLPIFLSLPVFFFSLFLPIVSFGAVYFASQADNFAESTTTHDIDMSQSPPYGEGSVSMWVKGSDSARGYLFSLVSDASYNNPGISSYWESNYINLRRIADNYGTDFSSFPHDNLWHNLVFTTGGYGGYFKIFIDGSEVSSLSGVGFNMYSAMIFTLGTRWNHDGYSFKGYIDEVAIFNYDLSNESGAIGTLYNNGLGVCGTTGISSTRGSLIANYHLDSDFNDSTTNAYNLTGIGGYAFYDLGLSLHCTGSGEATTTPVLTSDDVLSILDKAMASTTIAINNVGFGLGLIITLLFVIILGFIFNGINLKPKVKKW